MKLKYIIGILAILLLMAGTASAETFYLENASSEFYKGKVMIKVTCEGKTITVEDVSPNTKNMKLAWIVIDLPEGYNVEEISDGSKRSFWCEVDKLKMGKPADKDWFVRGIGLFSHYFDNFGGSDSYEERNLSSSVYTRGPIIITLDQNLKGSLFTNGNKVAVCIEDRLDPQYCTYVSGYKTIPDTPTQVPEFPTIALPVAAMLGLIFVFGRKKEE
ncbi:MAG: PEF-CTERM sorting domain-containing protein [Euryarchaeota archaeon]|nr:PEF-CTERM sorting domain-containing protein [Euryarchaeota archaeon]